MKTLLCLIMFYCLSNMVYAQDASIYNYQLQYVYPVQPIMTYQVVPVLVPIIQMVPVVPVTVYQNVLVKEPFWCLHHRYKTIMIPQQVYVPARY
jgi:hypothetical protein